MSSVFNVHNCMGVLFWKALMNLILELTKLELNFSKWAFFSPIDDLSASFIFEPNIYFYK